jgi:mutator protein MutT
VPAPDVLVAAAVLERDGRICIARRARGDAWDGYWEFPGGKLEPGETFAAALSRELREELGIDVDVGAPLVTAFHEGTRRIAITALRATWRAGAMTLSVHDRVAWVPVGGLAGYRLLPADWVIVDVLATAD